MFIEADDVSSKKLKEVLKINENTYREKVNLRKFIMCFSPNSYKETKKLALDNVGIPFVSYHEHYLRLLGKNKKRLFGDIKNRV